MNVTIMNLAHAINTHPIWALVAFALATLVVYGFRPLDRLRMREIPGPPPKWLVGNLLEMFKGTLPHVYGTWAKQYGKIFKVQFGATPIVVITDAEVGRLINLRNGLRPKARSPGDLLVSKNTIYQKASMLSTRDREYHRSLKSSWLPMFFSGSLDGYAEEMAASANILSDRLAVAAAQKETVNIWRMLGEMTMDVVGTCAFGVKLRTQELDKSGTEEARALISAARDIFQTGQRSSGYLAAAMLMPFSFPLLRFFATRFPDKALLRVTRAQHTLLEMVRSLVRQAREEAATCGTDEGKSEKAGVSITANSTSSFVEEVRAKRSVAKGSFLQLMISASHKTTGKPFTDVEIVQQAITFLLAGYETTASTLAFCVYNLAANPDKMKKLCAEVDALGKDYVPSVSELLNMPYVDGVFKESLRLYPPGFITAREIDQDCELLGYRIEKGTSVHVNVFGIQRDPEVWKDPEAFIPERWIEGEPESEARPAHGFMAFGDGSLSCVGMRFAQEEGKITLIRLLQRFTFELAPGQVPLELGAPLTLGPKEGIFVVPHLRA